MELKTSIGIATTIIIALGLVAVGFHYAYWRDNENTEVETKTSDGYEVRVRLSDFYAPDDGISEGEIDKFELIMDRMKYVILDYTFYNLTHNTDIVDEDIEKSYDNYGSGGNGEIDIDIEKIWWNDGNGTTGIWKRHDALWGLVGLVALLTWIVVSVFIYILKREDDGELNAKQYEKGMLGMRRIRRKLGELEEVECDGNDVLDIDADGWPTPLDNYPASVSPDSRSMEEVSSYNCRYPNYPNYDQRGIKEDDSKEYLEWMMDMPVSGNPPDLTRDRGHWELRKHWVIDANVEKKFRVLDFHDIDS